MLHFPKSAFWPGGRGISSEQERREVMIIVTLSPAPAGEDTTCPLTFQEKSALEPWRTYSEKLRKLRRSKPLKGWMSWSLPRSPTSHRTEVLNLPAARGVSICQFSRTHPLWMACIWGEPVSPRSATCIQWPVGGGLVSAPCLNLGQLM